MSHEIEHRSYKVSTDRAEIENSLNAYVRQRTHQEGGSGLYRPIRWIDRTFESFEKAREYIQSIDDGNYNNLCVKYLTGDKDINTSKTYKSLLERVKRLESELVKIESVIYTRTVKSAFVSCKKCQSKISTRYCVKNACPVCYTDLRSETAISRIKAKGIALHSAEETLRKFESEYAKKHGETRYLVKIEYHM